MESKSADIQRALIVYVDFYKSTADDAFNEFVQLVDSSGLDVIGSIKAPRQFPDAQLFVGKGRPTKLLYKLNN